MSQIRGSWLSLFAMLMIFIGPLISQAMPMDHHASMPMPMDMRMAAHSEHAEPQQPPEDHHALWEKCGYCSLLADGKHFPLTMHFEKSGDVTVEVSVQKQAPDGMQAHEHTQ